MKNLFKKALKLTIICSLLVLSSCEKDLYENSIQKSNHNKITLNQFKNETKIKDFKTLFKVPVSANGMLNRTAELSEFVIDTVAVQRYVSQYNKITYSFRIYTLVTNTQPEEKYNLVYTKENNIWEKSIIAFKERAGALPIENQFENFEKLYDSRIMSSSSSNVACITENYAFHCTNSGSCAETGACDMCDLCVTRTVTVEQCGGSGGTPSDPNGNGPVNPGPASYMPQDPFSFTPNLFDNPVFDDPNYINAVKANSFFNHLNYAQQLWSTENIEIYNQIIQYQINNYWSTVSNTFANWAVNYATEHSEESVESINQMITSMINNDGYSGDGFLADNDDENVNYTGAKQLIPQEIILGDGSVVNVTFGTTASDNKNANNEVAVDLVNAITFALQEANSNLTSSEKITSIYIAATTNGLHSSTSNHARGTAVDISRINSVKMINLGSNNQVKALQNAFDEYQNIRENFGPYFKHKTFPNGSVNLNWPVGGHKDHIHVSVQSN